MRGKIVHIVAFVDRRSFPKSREIPDAPPPAPS